MARKYELKQRAESLAATRERIVEATVALHDSLGPARTTISAIAERAGVQRLTVYRHFPDERSLFEACSGHWTAQNPAPDPSTWAAVDDPEERLGIALAEIYAFLPVDRGDDRQPACATCPSRRCCRRSLHLSSSTGRAFATCSTAAGTSEDASERFCAP